MHEWSLATEFVRNLEREGNERGAARITKVKLRIGSLSGVSIEAFRFAFEAAVPGTSIAPEALEIEEIPAAFACRSCGFQFADAGGFDPCPSCGSIEKECLRGTEMETVSFMMEESDV